MKQQFAKILTLAAYIAMVTVNYLATALPIAGRDTGAISDAYPNLFAPAGYTFAIWGLIYLLLGFYVIYQFACQDNKLMERVSRLFIINALLNASWIFAWHYDIIWLSVLIMLGLLTSLILIANIFRSSVLTPKERWLARLPFSIYFGWITVATIANITVFLVSLGWDGFGISDSVWMIIVLLAGVLIGSWRGWHDRNIPYVLTIIWAYGGILFKHLSESGFAGQYPAIIWTVGGCMFALALVSVIIFIKRNTENN